MEKEGKVIIIDWSIFMFRAIFSWRRNPQIPATWNCLNMITSCLRKVGVDPIDTIFVATDYMKSWRKDYAKEYKANRKAFRESFKEINWDKMWQDFNDLLEQVDKGTDWIVLRKIHLEADDFMAVGARRFKDKEVILITNDSDLEQCWNYPNVKIFSSIKKFKGSKGAYKIPPKNFDVYKFIAKKINKEVADNLVSPILNEEDYDNRKTCVDLLTLPDFVENQIKEVFDNLPEKESDLNHIRSESIRKRIGNLWNDKTKIVRYEDCVIKEEKKKLKDKKKKKTKRKK